MYISKFDMQLLNIIDEYMSTHEIFQNLKIFKTDIARAKMADMSNNFGQNLRAHREKKGLSLYRLAKLTGISQPNLTSIELGRRPASNAVLEKLAAVEELQIDIHTLELWKGTDRFNQVTNSPELARMQAAIESINNAIQVDEATMNKLQEALQALAKRMGYKTVDEAIKAAKEVRKKRDRSTASALNSNINVG